MKTVPIWMIGASIVVATLGPLDSFAESSRDWQFQATLYGYFPDIGGKTVFPPPEGGSSVGADIDDLIDDLNFAFMGAFEARRGQWGGFTDIIYLDVEDTNQRSQSFSLGSIEIPANVNAKTSYELKGWVWTLAGTYRAVENRNITLDVLAGARSLDIKSSLGFELSGDLGPIELPDHSGNLKADDQNWDAIVGARGRINLGQEGKWFIPCYLDIGTGESEFTWQALAGVGYTFGWGDVLAGWRHTDYKMESGGLLEDFNLSGLAVGATFHW